MATPEAIAQLRLLIAETEDAEPYTDTQLSARLDAASSEKTLVAQIWTEKAAAAAELVDTTEGGSSRKMGDIFEQALAMAKDYRDQAAAETPTGGRVTVVRRLRRP